MTLLHQWEATPDAGHPLVQLGALLKSSAYTFTTISTPSHRRVNAREGNETAHDLRGIFGWSRPFAAAVAGDHILGLMDAAGILERDHDAYRSILRASTLAGDLYFHSAFPTGEQDAVFLGPDTYRFAQVIDTALMSGPTVQRAIDLGCGAAAGAAIVAKTFPEAEVWATDINPKALALAAVNLRVAEISNVRLAHSDLLDGVDGQFDLIVANPPFMMDDDERIYCHGGGALGEGLSLSIVEDAIGRLAPGGTLVLYTCVAILDGHDPFKHRAGAMLTAAACQWQYREIDPDVFGGELGSDLHVRTDRIAAVSLVASRP